MICCTVTFHRCDLPEERRLGLALPKLPSNEGRWGEFTGATE